MQYNNNLAEALNPGEDWTGRSAKERRKIQVRLNVRAHRRRKAAEKTRGNKQQQDEEDGTAQPSDIGPQACGGLVTRVSNLSDSSTIPPLCPDHTLITLVQYNVFRAIRTNMLIIGAGDLEPGCGWDWDGWGRWGATGTPLFPAPRHVPASMAPTDLQRTTPHALWIDLLPDGKMRNNAIAAGPDAIDLDELEMDTTGCEAPGPIDSYGLVVWTDPWRPEGWEVTEGFVKKWGFLLKGCCEMLESTNRWRAVRGEEPLVVHF